MASPNPIYFEVGSMSAEKSRLTSDLRDGLGIADGVGWVDPYLSQLDWDRTWDDGQRMWD